ncbi:hypothetical protein [Petrimonas sp.]|uniref:hypothetical protein n=1 Tax=Petrimonas sp. TaxID=2023866 RepID=UPI003F512315
MNSSKNSLSATYIVFMLLFVFVNLFPVKAADSVKAGFSTVNLALCIKADYGYRYPLEAKCMVLEQDKQTVLLFALDFGEVYAEFCTEIQAGIGKKFNINPENILIHTTHTHSGPSDHNNGPSGIDKAELTNLLITAAAEAISKAKPAKVKIAEESVGKSLSVYRRADTQCGLGVQTYWFGYQYADGEDRPEASALINEMSSRWDGKLGNYVSSDKKVYFDGDVDPLVQTMQFVDMKNKPLGSIVRFSAHPHMASFFRKYMWDPDFPLHARKLMEKTLGGQCLFLQGTSGNIVPKEKVKYQLWENYKFDNVYLGPLSEFHAVDENQLQSETVRIGEDIAKAALKALNREKFAKITNLSFTQNPMSMPINPALPKSAEEIEIIRKALTTEYNAFIAAKGDLKELRRLANAINWLDWGPYYALGFINETDRKNGYKPMPYSVLKINSTPVVFMHSEVSVETTLLLREKFKSLWTVSLTGGTISYLPTDKMIDDGGYEGRNTIVQRGTEPKIREHIEQMLLQ